MSQYSTENKQRQNRNRKAAQDKEKRNIIIIISCIAALLVIAGAVFLINHFKKSEAQSAFEPLDEVTVSQTVASEPETEGTDAPAGTTVAAGEVTIEEYSATMYSTTVTLNVRSSPSADAQKLGMIGQDTPITVTGKCSNGWMRIDYNGNVGYCSATYLTGTKNQSEAPYLIQVNRIQNIVIIYSKDQNGAYSIPYKAMICSVGLNEATPTGTYTTTDKYPWRLLSGNVYGQYATRITGHYLFHSVPYFTQSKSDLEYDEYNKLGEAASLGCIRLSVADAKWIYDNCPSGTTVKIYDSNEDEPLLRPSATKIDTNDSRRGWDPTDPDTANPWNG